MAKKLKCFISASAHANISVLKNLLYKLEVETYDSYDFMVGERIADLVAKRIKGADFAVIVISESNLNVFYEMGLCEGLGKPLFVLIGKDIEPAYFVQKHLYLRTNLSLENDELLSISLTKFVHELRSNKSKPRRKARESKSTGLSLESANGYIDMVENLRPSGSPAAIEKMAQDLFSALNLQFEANKFSSRDKGVDFAIWDDSLALAIGNPLFIEIKSGTLDTERIHHAENQLSEYIAKTDAKAAILLYLDKTDKRFRENYSLAPLVLRFDLEDFIRELSKSTFQDVILSQRNKMVHRISS